MKLELEEIFFLKNAAESVSVKGKDAGIVHGALNKLEKEFDRLQKLQSKREAASADAVAK